MLPVPDCSKRLTLARCDGHWQSEVEESLWPKKRCSQVAAFRVPPGLTRVWQHIPGMNGADRIWIGDHDRRRTGVVNGKVELNRLAHHRLETINAHYELQVSCRARRGVHVLR